MVEVEEEEEGKRAEHEQRATSSARISGRRLRSPFDPSTSGFCFFLGKMEEFVADIGLLGSKIVVGWVGMRWVSGFPDNRRRGSAAAGCWVLAGQSET